MVTIFPRSVENDFHFQKTFVHSSWSSLAYKFVSIPIDENFKALTQVIPKSDVNCDYGFADWTVLQYSSLNDLSRAEKKISQSVTVDKKLIRVYNGIVDAKEIDVSLVLSRSQAIGMWKTSGVSDSLLRNILSLFFVSYSSIIVVPERCLNQSSIKYICIHSTGSKKSVSRVTDNTIIRVREIHSVGSFESSCSEGNEFRIEALDQQIDFLNFVYNAQLLRKRCKASPKMKVIHKILLSGPSGCGKTHLVKHFAELKKCGLVVVETWRVDHLPLAKIEKTLNAYFSEAVSITRERNNGICLLLFDELESLCREKKRSQFFRRGFPFMLGRFLDTAEEYPGLIIVATTNNIGALHSHIRCAGKMEVELHIGPPTEQDRLKILQMYCSSFKMSVSMCGKVANFTPGFFGSDLNSLVRNVARKRNRNPKLYRCENDLLNLFRTLVLKSPCLSLRHGLGVSPSRDIEMKHLGGLESVKRCLKSFVDWPLLHSDAFRRLGLRFPKGVLLYGPPGCAKTSLARAVACSLDINFLFVSAAELYSSFVGEAEKNVITLFDKARSSRPCIIFIDEIDALAGNRNTTSKNVQSQILSTFLTEMDGVGNKLDVSCINKVVNNDEGKKINEDCIKNVIVIAATNRPDKLDSALLRPGRFDKLIFVGPPNSNERMEILSSLVQHSKMPVNTLVDFAEIANKTDNFTGADLKLLLKEAGYAALSRDKNAREIVANDLFAALQVVKSHNPLKRYSDIYASFQ